VTESQAQIEMSSRDAVRFLLKRSSKIS